MHKEFKEKRGDYMPESQKIERKTLTMKETAEYLGISYWLVNKLVRRKEIPCSKVGGKSLFRIQVLAEYLSSKEKNLQITNLIRKWGHVCNAVV